MIVYATGFVPLSPLSVVSVGKQPVALKEYCADKGKSRKAWIGALATATVKMALNTIESINSTVRCNISLVSGSSSVYYFWHASGLGDVEFWQLKLACSLCGRRMALK